MNWIGSIGELISYGNQFSLTEFMNAGYLQMILCYNSISYSVFMPLGIAPGWYNSVKDETLFNRNIKRLCGLNKLFEIITSPSFAGN